MAIQTDAPKAIRLVRHSSAALAALSSRSWRRAQLTFLPKALLLLMVTHLEGAISLQRPLSVDDRDRGTPRDATPPTPPGIRVPYHGGSTELGLGGRIDLGKSERLEIIVAYGLLDRRVSGHAPEPGW